VNGGATRCVSAGVLGKPPPTGSTPHSLVLAIGSENLIGGLDSPDYPEPEEAMMIKFVLVLILAAGGGHITSDKTYDVRSDCQSKGRQMVANHPNVVRFKCVKQDEETV